MGALNAGETGDSSIKQSDTKTKYNTVKMICASEKNFDFTTRNRRMYGSSLEYNNKLNENEWDPVAMIDERMFDKQESNLQLDDSTVPYHRSIVNNKQNGDAVLVKDVGISCTLLNDNNGFHTNSRKNKIENYLVEQLRIEYNDLSNITRKMNAYTRDVLNCLSAPSRKKKSIINKSVPPEHANVSNYVDEKGCLCLKLRLLTDVETQCSGKDNNKQIGQIIPNKNYDRGEMFLYNRKKSCLEKMLQTISTGLEDDKDIPRRNSINGLTITSHTSKLDRQSHREILSAPKSKMQSFPKRISGVSRGAENITTAWTIESTMTKKQDLSDSCPLVLTNWKEISIQRKLNHKVLPPLTVEEQKKFGSEFTPLDKMMTVSSKACLMNNERNATGMKFHKINIRIVKPKLGLAYRTSNSDLSRVIEE